MDKDESVRRIRACIEAGDLALAGSLVADLLEGSRDDPMTALTCASMYATLGDADGFGRAVSTVSSAVPDDEGGACDIAEALLALDVPKPALEAAVKAGGSDRARRLRASALHELSRNAEALEELGDMTSPEDAVLRAAVLASLKRFDEALAELKDLVAAKDYRACRGYIATLMRAGRDKEAMKYARERSKDGGADGNALMAQFLWIKGNTTAAGAYASKAIKIDSAHVGAMEHLGYALAHKGETNKALIVAGAINEREPGNPAAFRIVALCNRGRSRRGAGEGPLVRPRGCRAPGIGCGGSAVAALGSSCGSSCGRCSASCSARRPSRTPS